MSQTNVLSALGVGARNVSRILSANGGWRIDEQGKLVVKEVEAEKVKSQKGYAVPDEETGEFYCIKVKAGAVVAKEGEYD